MWLVCEPPFAPKCYDQPTAEYLRENMEVVYEDFWTMVMLLDNNHRPASVRYNDEQALTGAKADFLP